MCAEIAELGACRQMIGDGKARRIRHEHLAAVANRLQPNASAHRQTDPDQVPHRTAHAGVDSHTKPCLRRRRAHAARPTPPQQQRTGCERRDVPAGTAPTVRRDHPIKQLAVLNCERRSLDVRQQERDGPGTQSPRRSDLVHPSAVSHGQGSGVASDVGSEQPRRAFRSGPLDDVCMDAAARPDRGSGCSRTTQPSQVTCPGWDSNPHVLSDREV